MRVLQNSVLHISLITPFSELPLRCSMNPSKFMKASAPMSKGSKLYWKCFNVQCRWCYSIFVIFVSQISKHLMFRRLNVALSKAEGQRTKSCKNWKPKGRFKEKLKESSIRYSFLCPADSMKRLSGNHISWQSDLDLLNLQRMGCDSCDRSALIANWGQRWLWVSWLIVKEGANWLNTVVPEKNMFF